jgi:hypothetical protein
VNVLVGEMMSRNDTVSVAFRSAETGRYLFWVKWPAAEWKRIEEAAAVEQMTVEEFILQAIERWVKRG